MPCMIRSDLSVEGDLFVVISGGKGGKKMFFRPGGCNLAEFDRVDRTPGDDWEQAARTGYHMLEGRG